VNEVNIPPVVNALPNKTIHAGVSYQVTASGSDGDLPPQQLTYILDDFGTTGATIDSASAVFSWMPTIPNTTNTFQIKVADNGAPVYQSAPVTFTLIVASELKITQVSREPSGVLLRWDTVSGNQYQIEYKDQLQDAEWTPLGQPQTAGGSFLDTTDTSSLPSQRFYRVRLFGN